MVIMRFLFVDRILQLIPGRFVRGIKHVTRDDAYLCLDDQGQLCFISSLIGEALGQLAAWNVMFYHDFLKRPVAGVASVAKLHRPVYVGETLLLESFIDALDDVAVQYHSVARVGTEVVFTIDGALGPLLPMSDLIDVELVRRQFAEIDSPGEWPPVLQSSGILIDVESPSLVSMTFDRVLVKQPGVQWVAEKCITRAAPYFPDHFPNKPVLPMTVLLECILNLARQIVKDEAFSEVYQVSEVRKIKMNGFVFPGDVLSCTLNLKHQDADGMTLSCRSEVNGKRVCVLELVMTTKGAV